MEYPVNNCSIASASFSFLAMYSRDSSTSPKKSGSWRTKLPANPRRKSLVRAGAILLQVLDQVGCDDFQVLIEFFVLEGYSRVRHQIPNAFPAEEQFHSAL